MTRFLNVLLLFGGYLLVYASMANGGRFATAPWRGVFEDAYGGTTGQAPPSSPGITTGPPVASPRARPPKGNPRRGIGLPGEGGARGLIK